MSTYTTNYKDYMDFSGGEIKFYKDDNYYCSIKLLTTEEYLEEKYNEMISLFFMKEEELIKMAKSIFPHVIVKTTREFFIAFFQFYDKNEKHFNMFKELFPWMRKFEFGFGGADEKIVEDNDLLEMFNHFLFYNAFRDKLEKPKKNLTAAEKRQLEMEERIRKIKNSAAKEKNKGGNDDFSYGKVIASLLKEFPSLTIKEIFNLPIKWFFYLSRIATGYSYHLAEIIAVGNGLLKKLTHYTEEKKND